jgi:tetratricopeptide (TPR) repeat protein
VRQRNSTRWGAGALGNCSALLVSIGLIAGCATYDSAKEAETQAERTYHAAWECFKEGRLEEGERYVTKAIEEEGEAERACMMALDCRLNPGSPFERNYAKAYSLRALIRSKRNELTLCIQDARTAIDYDDGNPAAHYSLGYCSASIGDLETGRQEAAVLESLNKNLASLLNDAIARAEGLERLRPEEEPQGDGSTRQ